MFDEPADEECPAKRDSNLDKGRTASDSAPSPIRAVVGFVTIPPLASIGIWFWSISKPKVLPPIPGTQSGIDTETEPIAENALLIRKMIALIGALASPTKPPNALANMFFTFSQAALHSPEKIFFTKSITLLWQFAKTSQS